MNNTQPFTFEYSKCLFKDEKKINLNIRCECLAYTYADGELRDIDLDVLYFNDEKIPDNLVWMLDDELWQEMREAAYQHADAKFFAIDTTPSE